MFEDLRDLYQEVILDHGRRPRHSGKLAAYDASARGDNPLCGDRITLWLQYAPDGTIARAGFDAKGCAISIASADLMAETVAGLDAGAARTLAGALQILAKTGNAPPLDAPLAERIERVLPLGGVHEFPSRVKCATLPWHALLAALAGTETVSSE
jgi:nitrogen fixation NifU-like protein